MKKVLLAIVILFILVVGGCMAMLAGAANEVDKAIQSEEKNDKPVEVAAGKAFTHDDYAVAGGWQVAKEEFGGVTITNLSVTNNADEARTAALTFRFYNGNENLAEVECTSNELQAGESSKLSCFSTDSEFPKGYKTIKVSDMW